MSSVMRLLLGRCLPVVVLLLVLVGPARAAEEYECIIQAGYGGVLPPPGGVVPITVIINNHAKSTTATIHITQQTGTHEVEQVTRVPSPAPSLKRFLVLARMPPSGAGLRVTVATDAGFAPTAREFATLSHDDRALILAVNLPAPYVTAASDTEADKALAHVYQLAKLLPADLPDEALAYDSVHVVAIGARAFARLAPEQLAALRDWVAVGGRLLLHGPERDADVRAALAAIGATPAMMAQPGVQRLGAGWLAADALSDTPPLWLRVQDPAVLAFFPLLHQFADEHDFGLSAHGNDTGLFPALTRKQGSYGWRGFLWLALIIGAYLAVIGPLDWWLVRRLGKPQLTWVFFGTAILLFSGIAYWYSSLVHAGTMQAVSLNLLDATADGQVARGNSLFWIYSTRNARYTLQPTAEAPPKVAFGARENALGAGSAAQVTLTTGAAPTITAKIPIFSSKYFDAAWMQPWITPIQAREVEGRLQVTLPPTVSAASVELADATGLQPLTYDPAAKAWVASAAREPWTSIFSRYEAESHGGQDYFQGSSDSEALPPRPVLTDLARWLSFGYLEPRPEDPQSVALPTPDRGGGPVVFAPAHQADSRRLLELQHSRDAREEALNIRPRVEVGGRVLFIVLNPPQSLLPLERNFTAPQTLAVDVLRVQLP